MAEPKTADEIIHIEHELEILRDRLARYIYWGGVLKVVVPAGGYVVAAVLVAASLAASNSSPAMSGVGLIAALIVTVVVWLTCCGRTLRHWVDMASQQQTWGWDYRYASEAEEIEALIAARVERLALLRGVS